ncbi:unnamed protein product [Sphagnum balticum]
MESVLEPTVGNIGSKILFPKFPVDPADLATLPESERILFELEAESLFVPVIDPRKSVSSSDSDLFVEEREDDVDVKTSWDIVPFAVCTGAELAGWQGRWTIKLGKEQQIGQLLDVQTIHNMGNYATL